MTTRHTPSDDEELQFNASFRYEVAALINQAVPYVRQGQAIAARDWAVADSLLESTLIRLRSMHQFFTNSRQKGDAIAVDLAPHWVSRPIMDGRDYGRISQRVAHLTYLRPLHHSWPIGKMVGKALRNARDFMTVVGCEGREGWAELLRQIEQELSDWGTVDHVTTSTDHHAHPPG